LLSQFFDDPTGMHIKKPPRTKRFFYKKLFDQ